MRRYRQRSRRPVHFFHEMSADVPQFTARASKFIYDRVKKKREFYFRISVAEFSGEKRALVRDFQNLRFASPKIRRQKYNLIATSGRKKGSRLCCAWGRRAQNSGKMSTRIALPSNAPSKARST
jgi:hypothetical protein